MRLNKVNVTTILIVQSTLSFVSSDLVSMYVRLEATSEVNFIYVNFYADMFQRMYNCVTDACTRQCNAKGMLQNSGAPYPAGQNLKVTDVTSTTRTTTCVLAGYFTCQYDQSMFTLKCTRNSTGQCGANTCTSFRLSNSSMCECVSLMWKYPDEELVYDNNTNIEDCKQDCTSTTTATTNPSNATKIANSGNDNSPSNSVPIIIGVVVGVSVIVIIIVVAAIIYNKRKKQTKRSASNDIGSSRADANDHRSPAKPGMTRTNIPDVLTTLPYGHGSATRGESEDGYYTIDKDYGLNRYENGLNTHSQTSDNSEGRVLNFRDLNRYTNELPLSPRPFHIQEGAVSTSDLPHTREGDYFTIETGNNESEDTTVRDESDNTGEYSLAKDVNTTDVINVIDVTSPPKNIYSRFGDNEADVKNPYDILLQKYEILNSRKNSLDDAPLQGTEGNKSTDGADTSIAKSPVGTGSSSPAFTTFPDMTRDVGTAGGVFPAYSVVS